MGIPPNHCGELPPNHIRLRAGDNGTVNRMCFSFAEGGLRLQSAAASQIRGIWEKMAEALPCPMVVTWLEYETQRNKSVSTETDAAGATIAYAPGRAFCIISHSLSANRPLAADHLARWGNGNPSIRQISRR